MNPNQRIPLIICIAFGICLGQLLVEAASMTVSTLVSPLLHGILGKVFNGLDSQCLQLGAFLSRGTGISVSAIILWIVWRRFAKPQLNKDTAP